MKQSITRYFVLLLLGLALLWGCGNKAGTILNGKADLPVPETIILRNNKTGVIKEFNSADEEFDQLYRTLNNHWGLYEGKAELAYYMMQYTAQGQKPPTCEAEFRYAPGTVPSWHIPWGDKTSDDVIGVVMALDKGANKAAYIFDQTEDFRAVTALVYEPSNDTLEYALSLLNQ